MNAYAKAEAETAGLRARVEAVKAELKAATDPAERARLDLLLYGDRRNEPSWNLPMYDPAYGSVGGGLQGELQREYLAVVRRERKPAAPKPFRPVRDEVAEADSDE